jgi:hypothetical protein
MGDRKEPSPARGEGDVAFYSLPLDGGGPGRG